MAGIRNHRALLGMMVFFDLKTAPKWRFQANRIYERPDFENPVPV